MLESKGIRFSYSKVTAFDYPDLRATANEPLLITGYSGSGKTTLLHILGGILEPGSGEVIIDGVNIFSLSRRKLDHFRGLHTSVIYQKPHFMTALSVIDNIVLPQYFTDKKVHYAKAREISRRLGIEAVLSKKPAQLSLGEQQRVTIARALINAPKLLLADEPTSSLDDKNCDQVIQLLFEQSRLAGSALVVVTHDARLKPYFSNCTSLS